MDILAIAGLAALILVKETGVPLPVPGDLVIIGAGATVAGDVPGAAAILAIILVAGFIGATAQFYLLRSALRRPLLAGLRRLGIGEERLEGLSARFRTGGAGAVAVARMTPGVRIGAIPASAIASLPLRVFLLGIVAGNIVFVTAHFALGFLLGAYAQELFVRFGAWVLGGVVVLVVLAIVGWLILSRRRKAASQTDAYECWADCSCPVCVTVMARPSNAATPSGG